MKQHAVCDLVIQVVILLVIPANIGFSIRRIRRLRRAGQPVPQRLNVAVISLVIGVVFDAIGLAATLTG